MILDKIRFDNGLIPTISQDYQTGEVLMFAFMSKESLKLSIETGKAVYFSRSRNKLWFKGEESGHEQIIKQIYSDCDNDVLLIKVEQIGGIACHTGRKSCFFNQLDKGSWKISSAILKDPKKIYGNNN